MSAVIACARVVRVVVRTVLKCGKVAVPLSNVSTRLTESDEVLREKFSRLSRFNDVAALLEITPAKLTYYLRRTDNYKLFTLRKRGGGIRAISSPASPLKIIQRKLNQVLHAVYQGRSPVHGFVRGKSIVTNASKHVGRQYVLNLDLEAFFPSIHFGRVKGLFEGKPYKLPEAVAVTLAQICCHNSVVPAGAPTSPIVANMVCAQMDSQLKRLAIDCGCMYTRYADDLTVSVRHGLFPPPIVYRDPDSGKWIIGKEMAKVITNSGFKINESKTRVLPRGFRQEVTGLVVGDRLNVKRTFIRQVRAMLHAAERWGVASAGLEFLSKYDLKQRAVKSDFLSVLRGRIEFVGSVRGRDDGIYVQLLERYLELDPEAHASPIIVTASASPEVTQRAIWLLEERNGPKQGTCFAVERHDLITAAHVLAPISEATCDTLSVAHERVALVRKDDHVDVARIALAIRPPVQFKLGRSDGLKVGDAIKVLGFPLHHAGASVNIAEGRITAFSPWHGVPHCVVDCAIVSGNSGGPVLNNQNEVVGIAVKGQGVPKRFASDDEQSRFVPIGFAIPYLTK